MSAKWRDIEFKAAETVAGHGRERVAREMREFLNNNDIKPGECFGSIFLDVSNPLAVLKDATACGILIYYK